MNAICHMLTKVECSHFKKSYLFVCLFACLFLEWRERGEKHQCVVVSHAPLLGTWPATQACALNGNRTGDPLVCRPALNPLSHTSQGKKSFLIDKQKLYKWFRLSFLNY